MHILVAETMMMMMTNSLQQEVISPEETPSYLFYADVRASTGQPRVVSPWRLTVNVAASRHIYRPMAGGDGWEMWGSKMEEGGRG